MTTSPAPITRDTPVAFCDPLPEKVDAVIIGGGVIGVFTALYAARMNKRVLVCEKGRIAGEQSSRNWGWIRQQGRDYAELPIMMEALKLWHEVDEETGGRCGVVAGGTHFLASSQAEMEAVEAWLPLGREHGLDTRILSAREVSDLFSGQDNGQWVGATCTPSDARGEPWQAVPAVAELAREAGALIREDCAVRALDITGGRIAGVITENGPVACEQVVLAGGAWSSLFARRHGISFPQLSVRATVAQTAPMPDFFQGNAADEKLALRRRLDGGYTLARRDKHGFYLGPDSFRHLLPYLPVLRQTWREVDPNGIAPGGFPDAWGTARNWSADEVTPFEKMRVLEPAANKRYLRLLAERFESRFPSLGRPKILTGWAGMIDSMPDVVPIVDRAPDPDGLIVATGMSGHGFGIGPGFGRILARMLNGDEAGYDMRRFRFTRFSDGSKLDIGGAL